MKNNIEKFIEYTILKPTATQAEVQKHIDEAIKYGFFGVCINPIHITFAKEKLEKSHCKIVTVIGFPLGANSTETKVFEAKNAIKAGADELDMVINIGSIKENNFDLAGTEIKKIVEVSKGIPVKVIIETDLLDKTEIINACKVSADSGAAFVKTSTGFVKNGIGATEENIKLMSEAVSPYGIQIKASGGIKDLDSAIKMINAGARRIGTSSAIISQN